MPKDVLLGRWRKAETGMTFSRCFNRLDYRLWPQDAMGPEAMGYCYLLLNKSTAIRRYPR